MSCVRLLEKLFFSFLRHNLSCSFFICYFDNSSEIENKKIERSGKEESIYIKLSLPSGMEYIVYFLDPLNVVDNAGFHVSI